MRKGLVVFIFSFLLAFIFGLMPVLFMIWGGNPKGVYWRIEDLKEEVRYNSSNIANIFDDIDLIQKSNDSKNKHIINLKNKFVEYEIKIDKLENAPKWFNQ